MPQSMLWYTLRNDNKTVYIIKLPLGPIKSVAIPLLDFTRNGHKYLTSTVQPATCNFPCCSFQWSFHCQALPRWPQAPPPLARARLCPHLLCPSAAFDCACVPPTLCVLSLPSFSPLLLLRNPAGSSASSWPLSPPAPSPAPFILWGYPSQAISSHLYSLVQTSAWDSRAVSGGLFIPPLVCIMRLLNSAYPKGNSWFPPLNLVFLKCSQP